jgi:hypothetical protein
MESHGIQHAGSTYGGEFEVRTFEYGELRSVYRSEACNYSYREFWF